MMGDVECLDLRRLLRMEVRKVGFGDKTLMRDTNGLDAN